LRSIAHTIERSQRVLGLRVATLTAGTILHNTKTPLTLWFLAAYLMTNDKRGVSALLLQRQLASVAIKPRG
jgi:hypothetical protein